MKPRKTTKKAKSFFDLTPEEREREVARFDRPLDMDKETRPLTAKERALFEKAVADGPHVSIYVSDGRRDVVIHLDDDLLAEARTYAKRKKTTLPKMIDRGLRGLLSFDA